MMSRREAIERLNEDMRDGRIMVPREERRVSVAGPNILRPGDKVTITELDGSVYDGVAGDDGAVIANTSPHEGAEVTIEGMEQAVDDLRELMGECRAPWCNGIAALHAHGLCRDHHQAEIAARRWEGNQPSAADSAPGVTAEVQVYCQGDWEP